MPREKPIIEVVAADPRLRERLLDLVRDSGLARVDANSPADVVCVGCGGQLPVREIEVALRYGAGAKRVPVVLMTSGGSEELAVEAFRHGVSEYIKVPFSRQRLEAVLSSLNRANKISQPATSECVLGKCPAFRPATSDCLLGNCPAIREISAYLQRVAVTNSNVLVTGATGTGKELVAQIIHSESLRASRPLVCINCSAVPDTLLESELFGYERGAFTGAHTRQDGKLKSADGGTVFLDEIGEMSLNAQAKLLRVLDNREILRLGSARPELIDVRVIAATNCDLESLTHESKFRRDLFFRLNVARVHLPPLRERKEDILVLASFFREKYNRMFGRNTVGFTRQAERILLMHDWPGNVRELRNVVEAAFINLAPDAATVDLPKPFYQALHSDPSTGSTEVDQILAALAETRWNKSRAAEKLHWSRMKLYRKMLQYRLSTPSQGRTTAA